MPNLSLGITASAMVPFSPLDFTPRLWLDASDTSTITSSSGNVSQWNDKSGNAYHVAQGIGTAQPKTGTLTLNGRNVLDFDGTSDYLIRENDTALGRNVTGMTIYAVVRYETKTNNSVAIATSSGTSTSNNRFIVSMQPAPVMVLQGRTLDSDSAQAVSSVDPVSFNTWYTQVGLYDYANTDLNQYVNGVLNGTNTSFQTATTTSNTDSLRLVVGANQNIASTSFMNGQIAEILVYHSAHTASQRALVLDYLDGKWGT